MLRRRFLSACLALPLVASLAAPRATRRRTIRVDQHWVGRHAEPDGSIWLDLDDADYVVVEPLSIVGPFLPVGEGSTFRGNKHPIRFSRCGILCESRSTPLPPDRWFRMNDCHFYGTYEWPDA